MHVCELVHARERAAVLAELYDGAGLRWTDPGKLVQELGPGSIHIDREQIDHDDFIRRGVGLTFGPPRPFVPGDLGQ